MGRLMMLILVSQILFFGGVFSAGSVPIGLHDPQQIHMTIGVLPGQVVIVWNTFNDTGESLSKYGKASNLSQQAVGVRTKFVDQGPNHRTQFVHRVTLSDLAPQTKYYYMVGSSQYGYSDVFDFTTWPLGNKWSPRLAVFGDLGNQNAKSLPRLETDRINGMYDAILHVGDFAYDMYDDEGRLGDEFMRQIQPLAASVPYMTCPGNHEEAYNFSNYRNRFWMPGDKNKRMYYSFKMGPIRFISVSTEFIFFPQYGLVSIVEHYKWLERELADANKPENRAKQPWVIVFGHRPMYCSNDNNDDCTHHESLIRVGIPIIHLLGWEKLYYDYGVDLAIWAHEHSYERLWPVYNREVMNGSVKAPYTNPKAPVHIITGSAGCKEQHDNFDHKVDPWSAFRSDDWGYSRMTVYNSTHLHIEQVSDDKDGKIIDSFMLIKDTHGSYPKHKKIMKPAADPLKKLMKIWKDFL